MKSTALPASPSECVRFALANRDAFMYILMDLALSSTNGPELGKGTDLSRTEPASHSICLVNDVPCAHLNKVPPIIMSRVHRVPVRIVAFFTA